MNVTETGYIKLHRSILSNPLANEDRPRTKLEAWLELLLAARYSEEPGKVMVGNKCLIFHRGEIYASLRYLAESWKWSKNKVDGFLSYLEKEEMISKRTDKGTGRTVITICNYAYYNPKGEFEGQPTGHEKDRAGTASGQHRDSEGTNNKKDKKGKKEEEGKEGKNTLITNAAFAACLKEYNSFMLEKAGVSAKIDGSEGKAMKTIISYLKSQIKLKKGGAADFDTEIPGAFKYILHNFNRWDAFHQKQLSLKQINSNLVNIINAIRNGATNAKQNELNDLARAAAEVLQGAR